MTSLRHIDRSDNAYLDAARACLLDLGWRRTTLTEVARRAGVSRMTIYRTWPDMPSLLADLMTREWAQLMQAPDFALEIDDPAHLPGDDLVSRVVAIVRALRDNELFVRIVEVDPELILPYLFSRRGRSQDLVLQLLVPAIRRGQKEGRFRAGDPAVIARGLLLTAHGFVLSAQTMLDDDVTEADLDHELALVLTRSLAP